MIKLNSILFILEEKNLSFLKKSNYYTKLNINIFLKIIIKLY